MSMAVDDATSEGNKDDVTTVTERGRFITVEGPDGAGKTTNLNYIQRQLTTRGKQVMVTREPGGTPLGDRIRALLLEEHSLDISAQAEALLIFAARAQHITRVIDPALRQGQWVLCDRFTDATYAYQGGGRQLGLRAIETLEKWVHPGVKPDLTFVFDVDVRLASARLQRQHASADRFESADDEFKQRVRDVYAELATREPSRVCVIDTDATFAQIQSRIDSILDAHKGWF